MENTKYDIEFQAQHLIILSRRQNSQMGRAEK